MRDASHDDPKLAYENYVNTIKQKKKEQEEARLKKLKDEETYNKNV